MRTPIFILVATVTCLFCGRIVQAQNDIDNFTRIWDGGISGADNPGNPNGVRNLGRAWELEAGFDLDDDGLKEFAAYDATDRVYWVWENTALGVNDYTAVYTIPAPAPLFGGERSILITDMDNDGNKELVVVWDSFHPDSTNGFDALQVYEHIPGSGEFLPATPQLTFDPPRNLNQRIALEFESQAGDFDLDGNVELLLTYRGQNNLLIAVLEFEGGDIATGSFNVEFIDDGSPDGSSGNSPADINRVHGLGVGNLNGDARLDFVMVPDTNPVEIRVYTTTGTDTWSMTVFDDTVLPAIYVTARGSNATPAIADFNGDGFNEVYIIGRGKVAEDPSNEPRLWVVSPAGGSLFDLATAFNAANFTDLQVNEIVPQPAQDIGDLRGGFVADGDNDGRLELYILSRELTTIFATEWVGDPNGDVTEPSNYATTAIYNSKDFTPGLNVQFSNIKVFDLDGDGPDHMDIVFTSPNGEHQGLESSIFVLEYGVVDVTWCDSDLGNISGARDTVYICVDDVTGLDIISYQLKITFDESVVDAVGATGEGTITSGFGPPTVNTAVAGEITVGGFGTTALAGDGRLLCLIFDVVGAPGASADLCIESVLFNAGDPAANVVDPCCPFDVINEFDVAGKVTYCPTDGAVENTTLALSGAATDTSFSDANGGYLFENLAGSLNYTVTPSKVNDLGTFSISCFDAALTAQIAVGLLAADHCDSAAADVDEDGNIFTFDAALICRFAVGLPPFGSADKTAEWRFEPEDRSYSPLNADQSGQDFTAILLGDVDGNWTPAASGGTVLAKGEASRVSFKAQPEFSGDGRDMTTSLRFDGSVPALAFQIELSYDAGALRYSEVLEKLEGWEVFVNSQESGRLRIGLFGTAPTGQAGEFIEIKWEILREGSATDVVLERAMVNNEVQATALLTTDLRRPLPTEFALQQNYPNPFNPETQIRFDIPNQAEKTVRTVISIYNITGQLVRVLLDEGRAPGSYKIVWDAHNQAGLPVPSGMYIYTIRAGDFKDAKKMLLLK